jgi:hypothetical protein
VADETQEVTMTLTMDPAPAKKGLEEVGDSAKRTGAAVEEAARKFRDFERQTANVRFPGPAGFDPAAEAHRRLESRDREQAVRAEVDRLRPPAAFDPYLEAVRGQDAARRARDVARERMALDRQQWELSNPFTRPLLPPGSRAGAGLGAAALAAGIVHTGISGADAAARAIGERGDMGESEATRTFAKELARSVPILGQFVTAAESAARSLSGLHAQVAGDIRGLEAMGRQQAAFGFERQGRFELGQAAYGLNLEAAGARTRASYATGFAAGLTPDRLAAFTPRVRFGEATAETGALRLAAAQTASEAEASSRIAQDRQTAAREAIPGIGRTRAGYDDAQRAADAAKLRVDEAERTLRDAREKRTASSTSPEEKALAAAQAEFARANELAKGKLQDFANAVAAARGRLDELRQSRVEAAQAAFNARGAAIAAGPGNELALVEQRLAASRAGATQAGFQTEAETAGILQLVRQAKSSGFASLAPEQRQRLAGFAPTADFAQRQGEALGLQSPSLQQILKEVGLGQVGDQEKRRDELAQLVKKLTAENNAELERAVAAAVADQGKETVRLMEAGFQKGNEQFKNDIAAALARQNLMNAGR